MGHAMLHAGGLLSQDAIRPTSDLGIGERYAYGVAVRHPSDACGHSATGLACNSLRLIWISLCGTASNASAPWACGCGAQQHATVAGENAFSAWQTGTHYASPAVAWYIPTADQDTLGAHASVRHVQSCEPQLLPFRQREVGHCASLDPCPSTRPGDLCGQCRSSHTLLANSAAHPCSPSPPCPHAAHAGPLRRCHLHPPAPPGDQPRAPPGGGGHVAGAGQQGAKPRAQQGGLVALACVWV